MTSVMFATTPEARSRLFGRAIAVGVLVMCGTWGVARASTGTFTAVTTSTEDWTTPGVDPALTGTEGVDAATTTVLATTTSTTTTTLPSAVTTIPENCPTPPVAQAVFIGKAITVDRISATFEVEQVRSGVIDAFVNGTSVQVRYGNDAQYLEKGSRYIVGAVVADAATKLLGSTLRDEAQVIGEADGLGSQIVCPRFDPVARTLHIDGTAIDTPLLATFLDKPWRLVAVVVVPIAIVCLLLVGAVWMRRGLSR